MNWTLLTVLASIAVCRCASGDEPNIDELLRRIPVLSPDNAELESFEFSAEFVGLFGYRMPVEVSWQRGSEPCVLLIDGKSQTPIFLVSEGRALVYDALTGEIWVTTRNHAQLLFYAQGNNLKFNLGFRGPDSKPPHFRVDLASLLSEATESGSLSQIDYDHWQLRVSSPSGKTEAVAELDVSREWPLLSLDLGDPESDTVAFRFRNVRINQPLSGRLQTIPNLDVLPPQARVVHDLKPTSVEERWEQAQFARSLPRILTGSAGWSHPDIAASIRRDRIDLETAIQRDEVIAPILREMLGVEVRQPPPASEQFSAPEEDFELNFSLHGDPK